MKTTRLQTKLEAKQSKKQSKPSTRLIFGFVLLFVAAFLLGMLVMSNLNHSSTKHKVAVLHLDGVIVSQAFGYGRFTVANDFIEQLDKASSYDGIIIVIHSNGGSAFASAKIAKAIEKLRQQNKTVVAVIDAVGLSGAYLVAATCNKIYADELSLVGSIGVTASYLEIAELLERFNITYRRLVLGQYKDIASPLKHLTEKEKQLLMQKLQIVYDYFVNKVKQYRNVSDSAFNGEFFLGNEAKQLGLIDDFGGLQEAKQYFEQQLNTTVQLIEFAKPKSMLEKLLDRIGFVAYSAGFNFALGFVNALNDNFIA